MFQRKPERKQLHQVDANSSYFTSHGQASQPKSPIEVSYAMGGGPQPPVPARSSGMGRRRSSASGGGGGGGFICVLLMCVIWTGIVVGCGYYYYESIVIPKFQQEVQQEQKGKADKKLQQYKEKSIKLEGELNKQTEELKEKQRESENSQREFQRQIDQLNHDVEFYKATSEQLKEKLDTGALSSGNAQQMQAVIQSMSRRALEEKFGPGPYRVEFEVNFPQDNNRDQSWFFTVELAPKEDMPHTVYTFLEQISRSLYADGGYSFYTNAVHIVAGGPYGNHLTATERWDRIADFRNSGWNVMAEYPEYSPNYPHEKFTLGLSMGMSSTAGGPILYINMDDNSKHHGPGGYDGGPDPCFGRITVGQDVVERMHSSSPGGVPPPGEWKDMEGGPIAVKSIRIM